MRPFIALLALSILIAACAITPSSDPAPLQLHEVVYGGCAGLLDIPESSPLRMNKTGPDTDQDTLVVEWDDSLQIFLGLNYICCAPFVADHEIIQDTLVLTVRDTCPDPYTSCYCRCMCYYTFIWKFKGGGEDVRNLRVELVDPRVNTVAVLYQEQLESP